MRILLLLKPFYSPNLLFHWKDSNQSTTKKCQPHFVCLSTSRTSAVFTIRYSLVQTKSPKMYLFANLNYTSPPSHIKINFQRIFFSSPKNKTHIESRKSFSLSFDFQDLNHVQVPWLMNGSDGKTVPQY